MNCFYVQSQHEKKILFEVGCGVGNFMFPLLEEDKHLYFYACDFSPRAVEFVKVKSFILRVFFEGHHIFTKIFFKGVSCKNVTQSLKKHVFLI